MQAVPQRLSCNGERRSIGRLKYTLVAAIAVAAAGVATSQTASAAKLTWKANPDVETNDTLFIFFEGPIAAADVSAVKTLITKYPKHSPKVILDSEGGDIGASMAIGRMLRARHAGVEVHDGKCLSSCVFIYAAGVKRYNSASGGEGVNPIQGARTGIGIHRFYFSSLPASATTADIQAVRNKQKEHIKSYLQEMNVSSQLLDAMEATPPEAMRMLNVKELASFGLAGRDPVYDEKTVAEGAASVGVSSSEYRKRTVEAKAYCQKLFDKRRGTVDLDLLLACEPNYVKAGRGNK